MKRGKTLVQILTVAVLFFLLGCAATQSGRGRAQLKNKQYRSAINSFLVELKQNRNKPELWRDLGIAYFKTNQLPKAAKALKKAYRLNSNDGETIFYLGAVAEKSGDYQQAIAYYKQFDKLGRLGKMRGKIEARLNWLIRKQMEVDAQKVLQNEQNIDVASIPDNSLAVLYFQNLGVSKDIDPLQKGLTDMLITDLSQVQRLKVVERVRMQKLLEEMGLGMTGLVDESTAPRFGKLLGASRLVRGTFIDLNKEKIQINVGLISAKKKRVKDAGKVTGNLDKFFRLEKELAFNILDDMGIKLTEAERKAISYIPTESLLAFMAYSKGLDAEDRGNFELARREFNKAVSIDPNFSRARQKMQESQILQTGSADVSTLEPAVSSEPVATNTPDTRSRLESSMTKIDAGFIPSTDPNQPPTTINLRKPVEEQSNTQSFGGVPVEIEIRLPQ